MSSIYCYVLIFLFFGNTKEDENNKQNVFITVYYESNCIDSKRFVMRQLIPMYELLHKYVDIEFIPFGKAYSINETAFECQHGPSECLGNLVQACTLKLIKGRADYKRILSYVACELNTKAGTRNNMQCVGKSGANVRRVRNCVKNGDGIRLMKSHERATDFINPQFIPTITFDGTFDQFIQDLALSDLIRASINETAFECQHGPSECLGNLVQACTLKLIKGRADYKRILSYVACELNTKAGTRNNMQCVGKSGANVRRVRNCVRNGDGIKLMKSHERATDFINPQFIPTITFDGSFDQFIQDLALSDLIRAVCSHFNYSVKECQ